MGSEKLRTLLLYAVKSTKKHYHRDLRARDFFVHFVRSFVNCLCTGRKVTERVH
jgi:hypothetical protein